MFIHRLSGPDLQVSTCSKLYFVVVFKCLYTDYQDQIYKLVHGVSVLALRATDRGFESWSDQTKDYKISIFYFSAKKGRGVITCACVAGKIRSSVNIVNSRTSASLYQTES